MTEKGTKPTVAQQLVEDTVPTHHKIGLPGFPASSEVRPEVILDVPRHITRSPILCRVVPKRRHLVLMASRVQGGCLQAVGVGSHGVTMGVSHHQRLLALSSPLSGGLLPWTRTGCPMRTNKSRQVGASAGGTGNKPLKAALDGRFTAINNQARTQTLLPCAPRRGWDVVSRAVCRPAASAT